MVKMRAMVWLTGMFCGRSNRGSRLRLCLNASENQKASCMHSGLTGLCTDAMRGSQYLKIYEPGKLPVNLLGCTSREENRTVSVYQYDIFACFKPATALILTGCVGLELLRLPRGYLLERER